MPNEHYAIGAPLLFNGLIFILMLTNTNARFANVENRIGSLNQRIDLLTGAIHDLDNRITRLEEHRR